MLEYKKLGFHAFLNSSDEARAILNIKAYQADEKLISPKAVSEKKLFCNSDSHLFSSPTSLSHFLTSPHVHDLMEVWGEASTLSAIATVIK